MEHDGKQEFNTVFRKALDAKPISIAAAARQLGIKRQTLQKYQKQNRYPSSLVPQMCALVDLRDQNGQPLTYAEAKTRYRIDEEIKPLNRTQCDEPAKERSLKEFFDKYDAAQERKQSSGHRKVDEKELFEIMGREYHALVIFTASVEPLVFRLNRAAEYAADAIRRGMYLCVIIPTKKVIEERYGRKYMLDISDLHSYTTFQQDFNEFRKFAVHHWRGMSDPISHFDRQVVLLESEDCLYHNPGCAFSLFGSYKPGSESYQRAVYRMPEDAAGGWHVNRHPEGNQFLFERRLTKVALVALRQKQPELPDCSEGFCPPEGKTRCAIVHLIAWLGQHVGDVERVGSCCPLCRNGA